MTLRLSLLATLAALACLLALTLGGDGMSACQAIHSFDVCYDAIH